MFLNTGESEVSQIVETEDDSWGLLVFIVIF